MDDLFKKSILDQMYLFRKEEFEQNIYDKNQEIRDIEFKICDIAENFMKYIEKYIPKREEFKRAEKMFWNYELARGAETDFWSLLYFKLGMTEREKISKEFHNNELENNKEETFLNYNNNNFSEWLEEQKRKYCFDTPEYKELQEKYRKISEKYPNATEVFEDLEFIELNKEEQKALIELRRIDVEMGDMEKNLCFKLGMKEVINF